MDKQDIETTQEEASDMQDSPRKKIKRLRGTQEKVLIPRLTQVIFFKSSSMGLFACLNRYSTVLILYKCGLQTVKCINE